MTTAHRIASVCALALFSISSNSVAAQVRSNDQANYQVTYNPILDHYCIRAYKSGSAGETKALGNGLNCRSKRAWERAGLKIVRRHVAGEQLAGRQDR